MVPSAGPSGRLEQFADIDGLAAGIAGEAVVDAQCAVVEIRVEVLCPCRGDEHHQAEAQDGVDMKSSHDVKLLRLYLCRQIYEYRLNRR